MLLCGVVADLCDVAGIVADAEGSRGTLSVFKLIMIKQKTKKVNATIMIWSFFLCIRTILHLRNPVFRQGGILFPVPGKWVDNMGGKGPSYIQAMACGIALLALWLPVLVAGHPERSQVAECDNTASVFCGFSFQDAC